MTAPVPPVDAGFDAVVAQLLAADPDVLYRRAAAVDAVVAELETARDGLRRETHRVQEVMLGATADGFVAESAAKAAAMERSLDAVRSWSPALRRAADELARARSAAQSLREQRAAWAGHPQAAEVEETFAAAARAELARVETVLGAAGGTQQPIAAVPGSVPAGGTTATPTSATARPQPTVVTAMQQTSPAPTAGIPGLTAPGPEAAGVRAASVQATPTPATVGAVPEGTPAAPGEVAFAPAAFALGGQALGAPAAAPAAAVPSGTLQSAPVLAARAPTVAPSGVLGRPTETGRAVTPATVTVPDGTRTAPATQEPVAPVRSLGAVVPGSSAQSDAAMPGGVVGMATGGVLGRGGTEGRTPAGTAPSPAVERTDATRRGSERATGAETVDAVAVPQLEAPRTAGVSASSTTPERVRPDLGPVPSAPAPSSSLPASSGGAATRMPTLPVTGDTAAIATLPVTTPTPDPRSGGRLPLGPAGADVGTPGAGPTGAPFMPMGAGMAGGMNQNDDRTRETSLTADPSNWRDDGVPGVLGRT
ncbi:MULTISPECIES: hypothetical protein [unclassified Pseudonocardia]|uniref:hypothetical protein n=1 Tax=unclassified Pseudonocardia TaxID=2619320 RepID=UPI00094B084B|nr:MULTISPECIES: hypothetical protein [unclassified Pseudonocardia]